MNETPRQIGLRIGAAMARDVKAEDMPRRWTGLDPQDADQATSAGLTPDTPEWTDMETAAREEYQHRIRSRERTEDQCEALDLEGIERCILPAGHAGKHVSPWGEF